MFATVGLEFLNGEFEKTKAANGEVRGEAGSPGRGVVRSARTV